MPCFKIFLDRIKIFSGCAFSEKELTVYIDGSFILRPFKYKNHFNKNEMKHSRIVLVTAVSFITSKRNRVTFERILAFATKTITRVSRLLRIQEVWIFPPNWSKNDGAKWILLLWGIVYKITSPNLYFVRTVGGAFLKSLSIFFSFVLTRFSQNIISGSRGVKQTLHIRPYILMRL